MRKRRRRLYGRVFKRVGGPGWLVQFIPPNGGKAPSGRTRYLTRAVASRTEGEALLREVRKAQLTGTLASPTAAPPECDLSVSEAIDGYLESRRGAGCAESTIAIYGYSAKAIGRNGLGRKLVKDVTVADVERYLTWRRTHVWRTKSRTETSPAKAVPARGKKASASTVARDRELLAASFNRLIRLGQIETNVVAKVPKPKKPTRTKPVLSKTEIRRLVEACDKYLRPLVLAGLFTGARRGELFRMVWGDINFEAKTIVVTRSKTGNSSLLPLAPPLAAELQRVKTERENKRERPVSDDAPIFLSRYGRVYRCIRGGWMAAMKRAGLDKKKGVTPHILRHCFAIHFLGVPGAAVSDLQEALGHSSLKTTSIYAQMADERMRQTVSGLDFGF